MNDIEYFEVETDKKVDELVNSFIKKHIPNLYAHFVDTDENDGQKLRVQLTKLIKEEKTKYLKREWDTQQWLIEQLSSMLNQAVDKQDVIEGFLKEK